MFALLDGEHVDKLARRRGAGFRRRSLSRSSSCAKDGASGPNARGFFREAGMRADLLEQAQQQQATARCAWPSTRNEGSFWGPGSFRRPAHIGGEFDPGSGSTLAACLMHASRTGLIFGSSHVADGCGARGQAAPGRGIAGGNAGQFRVRWPVGGTGQERVLGLTLGGACGRLARWGGNGFPRR